MTLLAVREEEQRARMLGISGVPLYVINEAVAFSGAQPAETLLEALRTTPGWRVSIFERSSGLMDDRGVINRSFRVTPKPPNDVR